MADMTMTSADLEITVAAGGPIPARMFIATMGGLAAIVSTPPQGKVKARTSVGLTIQGRASSLLDNARGCKVFPAVPGTRRTGACRLRIVDSEQTGVVGSPTAMD